MCDSRVRSRQPFRVGCAAGGGGVCIRRTRRVFLGYGWGSCRGSRRQHAVAVVVHAYRGSDENGSAQNKPATHFLAVPVFRSHTNRKCPCTRGHYSHGDGRASRYRDASQPLPYLLAATPASSDELPPLLPPAQLRERRHGSTTGAASPRPSPHPTPWPLPLASPARRVAQCPGRRPTAPTPAPAQVAPCAPWRRVHPPIWRSPPRRPPAAATGGHGWPQVATGGHWRPPATAAAGSGASREGGG